MAEKRKIPVRSKEPPPKAKPPARNLGTPKPAAKDKAKGKAKAKAPKDPYKAAEARADKKQKERDKKAGKRILEGAANLELQAKAIRQALDIDFASARDNNLGDIDRTLTNQIATLKTGHRARADEFLKSAKDTEMATGATQEGSFANLVRERQDTLTNILEQGAGETDAMKAMLMSARNWHANASEANRSYFDSMRSVNAGITDLNIDTKSSLAGAFTTAEGEKDRIWQDFYNRRSEAFTQLGNIKGQQADYYAQAKELGVKPKKGAEKKAEDAMAKAFKDSAVESGKGYTQQGLPTWISDYQGQEQVETKQSNSELAGAVSLAPMAKAEGATLRKWAS